MINSKSGNVFISIRGKKRYKRINRTRNTFKYIDRCKVFSDFLLLNQELTHDVDRHEVYCLIILFSRFNSSLFLI